VESNTHLASPPQAVSLRAKSGKLDYGLAASAAAAAATTVMSPSPFNISSPYVKFAIESRLLLHYNTVRRRRKFKQDQ
jgi:hypothetical protein